MNQPITTFKIRVDTVQEHAIGFELFAGERVDDTYVNVLKNGSYASADRIVLTPRQFSDFANRLIAYIYTEKTTFKDDQLVILWDTRCIIYDNASQLLGSSIFRKKEETLSQLSKLKQRELEKIKENRL